MTTLREAFSERNRLVEEFLRTYRDKCSTDEEFSGRCNATQLLGNKNIEHAILYSFDDKPILCVITEIDGYSITTRMITTFEETEEPIAEKDNFTKLTLVGLNPGLMQF